VDNKGENKKEKRKKSERPGANRRLRVKNAKEAKIKAKESEGYKLAYRGRVEKCRPLQIYIFFHNPVHFTHTIHIIYYSITMTSMTCMAEHVKLPPPTSPPLIEMRRYWSRI
jgi:hypothetical protein